MTPAEREIAKQLRAIVPGKWRAKRGCFLLERETYAVEVQEQFGISWTATIRTSAGTLVVLILERPTAEDALLSALQRLFTHQRVAMRIREVLSTGALEKLGPLEA